MKKFITSPAIRRVFSDYSQQYKAHPWWTFIAFLAPALGNIFVFFVPPLVMAKLVNLYVADSGFSFHTVGRLIALLAVLWLFGELLWRIGLNFIIKLEAHGMNALSQLAFQRLTERDYNFYTNNFVGSLAKKAMAFSRSFETFTDTFCTNIITNAFPLLFSIVVLWQYAPLIPLVLVGCLSVVIIVAIPIIKRRSKLVALRHEAGSRMVGRLSDALTNMPTIKSFAKEIQERAAYKTYTKDYMAAFKRAADFQNRRFDPVISPMYVGTNVIGLLFTFMFATHLELQPGALLVIFSYYSQITRIFWEINRIYRNIESSISEAAEFTDMFLTSPLVQDVPRAKTLTANRGQIEFKDVNFSYQDTEGKETFLKNFRLDIKTNQKVGLVGPSGSGKTTITRLLLRFINVQSGTITIDGQDISRVTQQSLRDAISYVPQEPLLFHRSLYENIAYGDETATKKDVVRAAKIAHADEFISHLPDGYQTLVGERGIKLSGGQRQRVAIARALLKKSRILVLDEATSSLDSESEKYIQDGFKKLMKNKTALVIAHRLSTIKNLDRIIVLDHGKIVQDGSHEELIAQKGLYATLWSHQTGEFL